MKPFFLLKLLLKSIVLYKFAYINSVNKQTNIDKQNNN